MTIKVSAIPDYIWADGEVRHETVDGEEIIQSCRWKFELTTRSKRKELKKQNEELLIRINELYNKYGPKSIMIEWPSEHYKEMTGLRRKLKENEDFVLDCLIGWDGLSDDDGKPWPINEKTIAGVIDNPYFERSIREAFDDIGKGEKAREGNSGTPPAIGLAATSNGKEDSTVTAA